MSLKLYSYWRSSASFRVRIALNLKALDYQYIPINILLSAEKQSEDDYSTVNPANLVPTFVDEDEDIILNQSLAIIEYLDERYTDGEPLIPPHKVSRARVRGLSQDIVSEIHPLSNLRVLNYLENEHHIDEDTKLTWIKHWITKGFAPIEKKLQTTAGQYCFGFELSMADLCLVPQVYNAHRFDIDMSAYPLIEKINENCMKLEAFQKAVPELQPDAP